MNTLRSLAVDIMFNTGASKLLEVDSAVDAVKSNAVEASENMDALGDSVEGAGKKADTFLGISKGFAAITGAGVALGGALMKLTSRADELNAGLRRVEVQTGVSAAEMREWIISVTDATSDVDGYVRSMEELIKMGVSTKEEFQAILPVFDAFGTATGKDMVEGIKAMNAVLSALDIPMSESAEHIDTLTWLTTRTTVSFGDLGRTMRREQARIRDMGLTFDEIAVAMAALEAEGIKGPRAIMAFQSAIQSAEGDVQEFWRGLGVSAEALREQNDLLLESEGLTEALADANARSLTWWDHLKHRFDMLVWSAGSFLEPVKDLGPVLIALGPLTKGFSKGLGLLGKGFKLTRAALIPTIATTWAWTTALLANPVTWIVLGIVALIAAIVLLWKNWDAVTEWLRNAWNTFVDGVMKGIEWIRNLFGGMPGWIQAAIAAFMPFIGIPALIITHWDSIVEFFTNLPKKAIEWGKSLIDGFVGGIKEMWNNAVDTVKNFANDIADKFKSFFGISSPSKLMMEYGNDITAGLQIGLTEDIPEIPVPDFPDVPQGGGRGGIGQVTFSPNVEIRIEGNADGEDVRAALERYFPDLMDEFFELLAVRMG